jgi:protease I
VADILMLIAPEMFRDEEYALPKQVLERRGAHVVTASREAGECRGKLGLVARADITLAEARASDYAAVVFVGGAGATTYFDDPVAHALARSAKDAGAVIGAICIAPTILAHAGLLDGRRATAFPSQEEDLVTHGAIFTGDPVTVDAPFVTANGPESAIGFGEAVAEAVGI